MMTAIADAASPGGNADFYQFPYGGAPINQDPNAPLVPTAAALQQVFDWFKASGGPLNLAPTGPTVVRGISTVVGGALKSPHSWEYAAGLTRQFNPKIAWRNDVVYRNYSDFYSIRTDLTTGRVVDNRPYAPTAAIGVPYDLSVIENTNAVNRQYAGLTSQFTFRPVARVDLGVAYTLSHAWGNFDGESASGPAFSDLQQYPEYKQASWYAPEGDLAVDQRHRGRLWLNYGVPKANGVTVSLIESIESGTPYGAVAALAQTAFAGVPNPGYLIPPTGTSVFYYFASRDAYRTEGQRRTDFALNYEHPLRVHGLELFGQLQIMNLFNQQQLCGCGASVFSNGGAVQMQYIDQTVTTNGYVPFNPLTTTPVEGVNWGKGTAFGHANSIYAYTMPRTMRVSFGVRF